MIYILSIYGITLLENHSVTRRWDFIRPFASVANLFLQENVKPDQRDRIFYESAPVLFIAAAIFATGVLPFTRSYLLLNLASGALFINALLAYVMVAIVMAGWAPNGVYSMIGGWRFLGQLIAYSMPVVMAITSCVMRAESMDMIKIVESQQPLWNIIYQPLGFLLFYLAAMALAFLPPFDLPVAHGEIAGGVWAEYTGSRLMIFRLGRLVLVFSLSMAVTVFFLGGWQGPWFPPYIWTFIKTVSVAASFFAAGRLVPRIRHDHMLEWSWKYATPLALLNILWVGILLLL